MSGICRGAAVDRGQKKTKEKIEKDGQNSEHNDGTRIRRDANRIEANETEASSFTRNVHIECFAAKK
jgi:hypothetical protein